MPKSVTTEKIFLPKVRLSFPHIYTPKAFAPGQDPRFQATFLLDPANAEHKALITTLKTEIKRIEKEAGLTGDVKYCLGSGDKKAYEGYAGMVYLSTSNTVRPTVVNRGKQPVSEGDRQAPYAGCYVNANVTLWTQKNQYGQRVNCNLRSIQFVEDGAGFGRAPVDADDEFEALEAGAPGTASDDFDI